MKGAVSKAGLYPHTERSWPFVYSMDSDSAQVGPSQVDFYAFNSVRSLRGSSLRKDTMVSMLTQNVQVSNQ